MDPKLAIVLLVTPLILIMSLKFNLMLVLIEDILINDMSACVSIRKVKSLVSKFVLSRTKSDKLVFSENTRVDFRGPP